MRPENPFEQNGEIPEYLSDLMKHPPGDWEDPQAKVVTILFEQSGILPQMAARNPELPTRVANFLIGRQPILVVGGESGMGKSLICADLRKIHKDLQLVLPQQLQTKLAVISWDRTHMAFFEEMSTEAGETLPLPKGETHIAGREIVSALLGDQMRFIKKYFSPGVRILLEAPLIDIRGETIFQELWNYREEIQTLIMHSPKMRCETFQEGRLMPTSGQQDSMQAIREKLLFSLVGRTTRRISLEEQDEIVKQWWIRKTQQWNGAVIEWDPDDNRQGYKNSVAEYRNIGIKPDVLTPRNLSRFTRNHLESVFGTIEDMDQFLRFFAS